jgi:hypothetical protein
MSSNYSFLWGWPAAPVSASSGTIRRDWRSVGGMTDEPDLGDAEGEWYYCFKHKKVETRDECHQMDRMGTYPTKGDAEHWREHVAERNKEWNDE